MSSDEVPDLDQEFYKSEGLCPIFGIESGIPLIGLGVLLIMFPVIPLFVIRVPFPVPAALLFGGFGVFLIWVSITK